MTTVRRTSARLPATASSARIAREMISEVTGRADNPAIATIVTELVTNAVRHARAGPVVSIGQTGAVVRIEVFDDGPGRPVMAPADPDALSGRGMAIVDTVAERWGVDESRCGKTVWAEVTVD